VTTQAPGWYPFENTGGIRYWDGTTWNGPISFPAPTFDSNPVAGAPDRPAGGGSYVAAVLLPIVGVVLAVIQFARSNIGHGFGLLTASFVSGIVWALLLAAGSTSMISTSSDSYLDCVEQGQSLTEMEAC
jgi:hypothetical protein